jgi:GTP-binding protein
MFFDATQTISRVDKQLVTDILDHAKPCIVVVNKWDLGLEEDMTTEKWAEYLLKTFPSTRYVPVAFITAQDSVNIKKVINLAQTIFKQSLIRVSTGKLNRIIRKAIDENAPPHRKNRRPKIYYATQVAVQPPTIIVKCNDPELFDETWKRYLLSCLRDELPFDEVPIRLYLRPRSEAEPDEEAIEDVPKERFKDE